MSRFLVKSIPGSVRCVFVDKFIRTRTIIARPLGKYGMSEWSHILRITSPSNHYENLNTRS